MILLTQAPNPPTDQQATSGTDVIVLTWQPPIEETPYPIAYKIYRNGELIAGNDLDVTRPAFTDRNISPGMVYVYYVTAFNTELNLESSSSNVVTAEIINTTTRQKERTTLKFPKFEKGQWKVSINGFIDHREGTRFLEYGADHYGNYKRTYYPEILYQMIFSNSYYWDIGIRLYFAETLERTWNGHAIFQNPYTEIYNKIKKDIVLIQFNDFGLCITPYIEPRALIDDGLHPFMLMGTDLVIGPGYGCGIKVGIVSDIADIEDIQYKFGIDIFSYDKGYGFSLHPYLIINPGKGQWDDYQSGLSLGYTFK